MGFSFLIPGSIAFGEGTVKFLIRTIAEQGKQIKGRGVADQPHHVASPVEYCRTTFAAFEMSLHPNTQAGTDLVLQVIRDLAPYLFATDFHYLGPTRLHPL